MTTNNINYKPADTRNKTYLELCQRISLISTSLERVFLILDPYAKLNDSIKESIRNEFQSLSSKFLKNIKNEGKKESARKYKEYYRIATCLALEQQFNPMSFTKSNKDGVPRDLVPLLPLLKGDKWMKRFGLTVCRLYTLIKISPDIDVTNVVKPSSAQVDDLFVNQFTEFVNSVIEETPLPIVENPDFNFGAHKGPNGEAVLTSHYDAVALKRANLSQKWNELASLLEHPLRSSFSNMSSQEGLPENLHIGKISFIPEKGGKTRIIAVPDFWTQQLLKPFHQQITKIIRKKFPNTDSTFDQDKAFKRVLKLTKGKKVFSYDLRAATDRFPFYLQHLVFTRLFGLKVGNLWKELLVERDWYVPKLKSSIRWAVGQPLGCYSSWIIFTLTHHLIIQYAALLSGLKPFDDYQILGDDVVIWNEHVAYHYESILNKLGVEIAKDKSIISIDSKAAGEFSKRLFIGGVEVSPLSLEVMVQSQKSLYAFPNLLSQLQDRWEVHKDLSELYSLWSFPLKERNLLRILFGLRHLLKGETSSPWCVYGNLDTLLEGLIDELSEIQVASTFTRKPSKIQGMIAAFGENLYPPEVLKREFDKLGLVVSDSLLKPPMGYDDEDPHPILLALTARNKLELNNMGLETFTQEKSSVIETDPEIKEQIALIRSERSKIDAKLDIFFYKDTERTIPKISIDLFYKLMKRFVKRSTQLVGESSS